MAKIGVIGAGSWGTALALLLHTNGHQVSIWSIVEAEIEMLKETVGELKTTSDYYQRMFETSRAETIKDFAEKLKEKRGSRGEIWDSDIDNLVKEMGGADNE